MNTDYSCRLTILTPTYNRGKELKNLADSLCKQSAGSFQWLVIDDGSNDDTKSFIESLEARQFEIEYHYKENGGKHTALNYAHPFIRGKFICIVDSDDTLVPDAVEIICKYLDQYEENEEIACLSFQKAKSDGVPLVKNMPDTPVISDHISFRLNGNRPGDCCEVVRTSVFKQYHFPVFPGERFMSEGFLWTQIALKYKTVYLNQVIYLCEYLENGLTNSGRSMRIRNPLGGMLNSNSYLSASKTKPIRLKLLEKETLLYICYGKFAGMDYGALRHACARPGLMTINYPLGIMLFRKWKKHAE